MTSVEKPARYASLAGRPVIVTGGATGIGEALVRGFTAQGSKVGFVDIDAAAGQSLAVETGAVFVDCDVTDIEAMGAAFDALAAANGPAHVLINNAANDLRQDWATVSESDWDALIGVNLKHSFFAIQKVAPAMVKAGGGSIINFGSMSWMRAFGNLPCYTASKAAMQGLTRSFARDLGRANIRVNTIVPGWVMTKKQLDLWVDEAAEKLIDSQQCLAGRVMPDDIAAMALFLGADDSRMCSAQNFIIDGGWV